MHISQTLHTTKFWSTFWQQVLPAKTDRDTYWELQLKKKYSLPYEIYEKATTAMPTQKRCVSDRSLDSRASHFPIKGRKGRCIYCRDVHGVRHESSVRCDECDVALCIDSHHGRDSCFKLYHIYWHPENSHLYHCNAHNIHNSPLPLQIYKQNMRNRYKQYRLLSSFRSTLYPSLIVMWINTCYVPYL